jgi:hypothetical protein
MILGVNLDIVHVTLPGVGLCSPGDIQQLYPREFVQRQAVPDSYSDIGPRSAPAFSSLLITEHSIPARLRHNQVREDTTISPHPHTPPQPVHV